MSDSMPQNEEFSINAVEVAKQLPDVPLIVIFKVLAVAQNLPKEPNK